MWVGTRRAMAMMALLMGSAGSTATPGSFAYSIDPAQARVQAKVGFFGLGSKTAHFPRLEGRVALSDRDAKAVTLDVRIDAQALEAGDSLTRSRLRGPDFFDVERYPRVTFHGSTMTRTGPHSAQVTGTITARGVARPVIAVKSREKSTASAATTRIDRRDFGMTAYPLIVGRQVTIAIDADLLPVGG